jgi:mannose-6-phosphate isomerase-like protein (cupin superfamily)
VATYVVAQSEVESRREPEDTAEIRVTFDRSNGCERLEQRVIRFHPGRSLPRALGGRQEILYVVSGTGTLWLGTDEHPLEPETSVFLGANETWEVETAEELEVVSVTTPAGQEAEQSPAVVRFADCEEKRADENRTFRVLLDSDVTQFVGLVTPSRAPDHSHPYDEVGFILDGQGLAHVGGASIPIGPGSCFHLPPEEVHCIENIGPPLMRIMGVFYPAGSPKQRAYDAAESNK